MGIESLKSWHWAMIGLLLGFGAGYACVSLQGPPRAPVGMGQKEYELMLRTKPDDPQTPALDEITVVPVGDVYWVSAQRRYVAADGRHYEYRPEWLALKQRQYQPLGDFSERGGPGYDVRTYLADMTAKYPHIHFRYAWEREPKYQLMMWTGGGLLLIGVVWPILLRLLIGAGFGKAPAEAKYDLSRFGGSGGGGEKQDEIMSEKDQRRLSELDAEMQRSLTAESGPPLNASEPPPAESQPAELRGEALAAPPVETRTQKEYGGEFYPTEAHAPHKGQAQTEP